MRGEGFGKVRFSQSTMAPDSRSEEMAITPIDWQR
jgi:hypothetical protein